MLVQLEVDTLRRKDGQPKRQARRTMPSFEHGFKDNPNVAPILHNSLKGAPEASQYRVVSFFSGCGGLDLGLLGGFEFLGRRYPQLPFRIEYAADNSEDAAASYALNIGEHIHCADLTKVPPESLPAADVLIGGFPCQDFSSSGPKTGINGKRGELYKVMLHYMNVHKPAIVIGENVPHLARLNGGVYLETILKDFESAGYHFDVWSLYAPDFGLPQSRTRLFLIGVRNDIPGYPVVPERRFRTSPVTIDTALRDLEPVTDETVPNQSQYFVATKATSGGGQGDHHNEVGKVGYCIRANSRGRIQFHYNLPRRLTVRECARLQSFPDEFVFPFSTQRNLMLIGNAVPPLLANCVGESVARFLNCTIGAGVVDKQAEAATAGVTLIPQRKRVAAPELFLENEG